MRYQLFEKLGLTGLDMSIVIIILAILTLISMVIAIISLIKYDKLNKKYKKFMGGNDAKALESYIMNLIDLNKENKEQINAQKEDIEVLFAKQRLHFQKIGMNKYDAFREMGGNLSFALALLDENNDGFLINSVHNIQSSYCYVKEIKQGKSSIQLSEEEQVALDRALKNE